MFIQASVSRRVAQRRRCHRDGDQQIFVINIDGTGLRQLTADRGADPTWSPDGNYIAFTSGQKYPYGIYIMQADGTVLGRLADGGQAAWGP